FRHRGMYLLYLQWILYFFYFSFVFHAQLGYRYCLMLLPLAYLFIAVVGKDWWNKPKGMYAVLAVALVSFVEIIPYWGHPIAFSNSLVLPKRKRVPLHRGFETLLERV